MIGTRTYQPKETEIEEKWYLVDAGGEILGRLASRIAHILRGKNKADFSPHIDPRVHCVVINAEKIKMTGNKWTDKEYYRHSGWVGGIRRLAAKQLIEKKPEKILELAVKNMLPKNKLGRKLFSHLHVYCGEKHPHQAQQPEPVKLTKKRGEED